jgi:hypothetical protein
LLYKNEVNPGRRTTLADNFNDNDVDSKSMQAALYIEMFNNLYSAGQSLCLRNQVNGWT